MDKIMFLGDVHGSYPFMKAAIDATVTYQADAIVQVGDFGVWDHVPAGVDFLDRTNDQLERKGKWLIFVDGNHENFDSLLGSYALDSESGFRLVRDRILHAPRGHVWSINGLNFLAFGGASSIDGPDGPSWWGQARGLGNGWWPQERISEGDVQRALEKTEMVPIDVMVTHDCPDGVSIPGIGKGYPAGDACRKAVRAVMDAAQPQLLVCGHYHRRHTAALDQTRVEILSSNEQKSGQAIFLETSPMRLITEG